MRKTFLFSLNYANIKDCLPLASQLHRASTLCSAEQNQMVLIRNIFDFLAIVALKLLKLAVQWLRRDVDMSIEL